MEQPARIMMLATGFGLLVGLLDTVLDYLFFYPGHSFKNLAVANVPPHEIYIRLFILGLFVVFGLMVSQTVRKLNQSQEELGKYKDHLKELVEVRTRELKQAQDELVRTERLAVLGQLTATMAHEIRNPLGTVRTAVFSIGDAVASSEPARVLRAVKLAERNIVRCDGIIEELLDFSRTKALNLETTNIDRWVGEVAKEANIPQTIRVDIELNSGATCAIDPERLRRALANVIQNAVHAIQDPVATEKRLTLRTRVNGNRIEILVLDTGPGIPDNMKEKIFEPLFSTKGFGIGMGLPIVKNIMSQHHGGIDVQGVTNEGNTVVLWLPGTL